MRVDCSAERTVARLALQIEGTIDVSLLSWVEGLILAWLMGFNDGPDKGWEDSEGSNNGSEEG